MILSSRGALTDHHQPEATRLPLSGEGSIQKPLVRSPAMGTAVGKPVYGKVAFTRSRIAAAVSAGCASGSQWPAFSSRNS
jgi:hypothetical protein